MPLYRYVKAPVAASPPIPEATPQKSRVPRRFLKLIPPALITLGSIMVANVAWPILSYQLFTAPAIQKTEFIAPVSSEALGSSYGSSSSLTTLSPQTPQVLGADIDYTNPQTWFPSAQFPTNSHQITYYTLDIPSLDIEAANVIIGSSDLSQSLIHYPGTAYILHFPGFRPFSICIDSSPSIADNARCIYCRAHLHRLHIRSFPGRGFFFPVLV